MRFRVFFTLLCAIAFGIAPVTRVAVAESAAKVVYTTDFREGPAPKWSPSRFGSSSQGSRRFLGPFGKQSSAILNLDQLPPHRLIRVRFTLFLLHALPGNAMKENPNLWSLSVQGGPMLLRTTFDTHFTASTGSHLQSFPDDFPAEHPAATGAAERGSLGNRYEGKDEPPFAPADIVYDLEAVFPHEGDAVELRFSSDFTKGPPDEDWGLKEVTVEAIPEYVKHSDAELRQLWAELIGRDAMRSWNALWRLVEAGPETAAFVVRTLGADDAEARAQRLVRDLTTGDSLAREKANATIDDLTPADTLMLQAALAAPGISEPLRGKLQKIIVGLTAESPAFTPRVIRLLRVIGTPEANRVRALLEPPAPPAYPDSPMTLAWQNSHAISQETPASRCVFTPDGKQLLSIGGDGVRAWDVSTGKSLRFVPLNDLRALAISPDGTIVAGSTKQSVIHLWRFPDWTPRAQLRGHRGILWGLAFKPDSKQLWSAALDGLRKWDLETSQELLALPVPAMTEYLSISADGKMLAASQNSSKEAGRPRLTLRDGETGEVFHNILNFPDKLPHSEFSPDGKLIAVTPWSGEAEVFSVETKKSVHYFDEPSPNGLCVTFSPRGKYLCVAGGGGLGTSGQNHRGLHLYRLDDEKEVWRFNNVRTCYCVAFSADGTHLAAGDDEGRVYLWNVRPDFEN